MNEIYSKPPKKKYATNKTDVYHIDDIWSLDVLDLQDYGPENNRGYRYVLEVIDKFSNLDLQFLSKLKKPKQYKTLLNIFL